MTDRLDELMAALADGALSAAEADELEQRLGASGPEALGRARALLDVEVGLRRSRVTGDVNASVMAAIGARQGATVERVMEHVERRAPVIRAGWRTRAGARRGARRGRWIGVGLVLAGAAAFASIALWRARPARRVPTVPAAQSAMRPSLLRPAPRFERLVESSLTSAPAGTLASPNTEPRTLFAFDFEDGVVPSVLRSAAVVAGPERAGNRFVAVGGLSRWEPQANLVQFELERPGRALSFTRAMVVSFDCWAGADTKDLTVQLWSPKRAMNFHFVFPEVPRERWVRVSVRLADLTANDFSGGVLGPGDRLTGMVIVGGRFPGGGLFVDNVRAVEYPEGAPLPQSGITPISN